MVKSNLGAPIIYNEFFFNDPWALIRLPYELLYILMRLTDIKRKRTNQRRARNTAKYFQNGNSVNTIKQGDPRP